MVILKDAQTVWGLLKGIICVYKPANISINQVRSTIVGNICKDFNDLEGRPLTPYVLIEGNPNKQLTVNVRPSFADHPLVIGPRYQTKDVKCYWTATLGVNTSGVLVMGINEGTKLANILNRSQPTRTYRVSGIFGSATENFFKDGKVVEKSTYKHIKQEKIERLLASMQAAHQKKMFELSGVDTESQAAYDLATQGLIRPENTKIPLLYGIKCISFNSPDFVLEIQCINEYEKYLQAIIHDLGVQLHSTAHCTAIQCIRHSYFTLDQALLRKHWTLQQIIKNMQQCKKVVEKYKQSIYYKQPVLQKQDEVQNDQT